MQASEEPVDPKLINGFGYVGVPLYEVDVAAIPFAEYVVPVI